MENVLLRRGSLSFFYVDVLNIFVIVVVVAVIVVVVDWPSTTWLWGKSGLHMPIV